MLTNKQIGARIKSARDEKRMTLQEVADKVGVAKSTIQRYENGGIETIKLPIISAIANALNVDPSWIIGKIDEKNPSNVDFVLEDSYFSFAKEMQEKKISKDDMDRLWKFYEMIKKI